MRFYKVWRHEAEKGMPQLGGMLALGIGMAWFFCALCDVEARGSGMACTHFMDYWTYVFEIGRAHV